MPMLTKIVFLYNYQICKVITCQICKIVALIENQDLCGWSLDTQSDSCNCSSQTLGALTVAGMLCKFLSEAEQSFTLISQQ